MGWTFKDLLLASGENVVRLWLNEQPLKARLKIDAVLRNLRVSERLRPPFVKKLGGYEQVFEIVVDSFNVQYRPLGGYGPDKGQFTLVMGAIEQSGRIQPPNAFDTAASRLEMVANGTLRVTDHDYENPALDLAKESERQGVQGGLRRNRD